MTDGQQNARQPLILHTLISGWTQSYGDWHGVLDLAERLIAAGHAYPGRDCRAMRRAPRAACFTTRGTRWNRFAGYFSLLRQQRGNRPTVACSSHQGTGGGRRNWPSTCSGVT